MRKFLLNDFVICSVFVFVICALYDFNIVICHLIFLALSSLVHRTSYLVLCLNSYFVIVFVFSNCRAQCQLVVPTKSDLNLTGIIITVKPPHPTLRSIFEPLLDYL